MKPKIGLYDGIAYLFLILYSIFFFAGIPTVPFHPDESTQIFMSTDADFFLNNPSTLFWKPENLQDQRQVYRILDAPLARTLIGLGRIITSQPATLTDWNWSKSWDENLSANAFPSKSLLITARVSTSFLIPLGLLLFYFLLKKITHPAIALAAMGLLAIDPLVLLHTRRSMAEGPLLFTVLFFLWSFSGWKSRPYLNAIPAALAFCAKQSVFPFLVVGLCYCLILAFYKSRGFKLSFTWGISYFVIAGALILFLNPFLWGSPIQAALSAVQARNDLTLAQTTYIGALQESYTLNTIEKKTLALTAQTFFTPPAVADVGNYPEVIIPATHAYLSNPLHNLTRSIPAGLTQIVFLVAGLLFLIFDLVKKRILYPFEWGAILLTFGLQTAALLILLSLPFQRYYLPLIPIIILLDIYMVYRLLILLKVIRLQKEDLP